MIWEIRITNIEYNVEMFEKRSSTWWIFCIYVQLQNVDFEKAIFKSPNFKSKFACVPTL